MSDCDPEQQRNLSLGPCSSTHFFSKFTYRYANWLVSYPIVNSILIVILLISTSTISICFSDSPYFDDPSKDFITMGTPMAAKFYQLKALQHNTLSLPTMKFDRSRSVRSVGMRTNRSIPLCFELPEEAMINPSLPDQGSDELWSRFASMSKVVASLNYIPEEPGGSFLAVPGAIQSLCQLQMRFEELPGYRQLCSKASLTDVDGPCCPIWSMANFITSITDKSSCEQITSDDVTLVRRLYTTCKDSFFMGLLKLSCWDASAPSRWLCPDVPPDCFTHPHLLLLLAVMGNPKTALLVLPLWRSVGLQMWHLAALDRPAVLANLTRNLTPSLTIKAIELGEYGELSALYVAWDSVWLALGAVTLVMLLLFMSKCSVPVVVATFLALGWSLVIAYGLYSCLLLRRHDVAFPLLNMMALVLLLGLGADDILLFYQVWISVHRQEATAVDAPVDNGRTRKAARNVLQTKRMALTLFHAVPSVCLTSLSTLGGLLMSLNASTVAVKRFAVYASLTVICHAVYVLVVMPTLLYLLVPPRRKCCLSFRRPLQFPLVDFIIKIRYVFPLLLVLIISISACLLFHAGWLTFPSTGSLQPAFYRHNHPSDVYRLQGSDFSWAEAMLRRHRSLVSLHAVWGVTPNDPRNPWTWTPQDDDSPLPQPLWNEVFNLTDPRSLDWLGAFCSEITKMPRIWTPPSVLPRRSFLEEEALFFSSQNTGCVFGNGVFSFRDFEKSNQLCAQDMKACLMAFAEASSNPTGIRFSQETGEIVGLIISFTANISLINTTFSDLQEFGQQVETWFSDLLRTAPPGMKSGFLVSPELAAFETYQDALNFLPLSVGLSVTLATILVFVSTWNLSLALTALISVVASLLLSCLLLVILGGWSLGIVEALILSLSAGLAVDPCIHLALAIMNSEDSEAFSWKKRSRNALEMVGCAVTGAALSTALAGSAVLPSQLKCYQQMGLFLLILMTSALLLCGVAFVGSAACLPDRFLSASCWSGRRRRARPFVQMSDI
ncbi:hypothetical protein Aperf_G00000124144 [Anoplocephala perfoliata]